MLSIILENIELNTRMLLVSLSSGFPHWSIVLQSIKKIPSTSGIFPGVTDTSIPQYNISGICTTNIFLDGGFLQTKDVPPCLEPQALQLPVLGTWWAGGKWKARATHEGCAGCPCGPWRKGAAMGRMKCSDGSKDLTGRKTWKSMVAWTLGLLTSRNLLLSIVLSSACSSLESYGWDCEVTKQVTKKWIKPWLHLSEQKLGTCCNLNLLVALQFAMYIKIHFMPLKLFWTILSGALKIYFYIMLYLKNSEGSFKSLFYFHNVFPAQTVVHHDDYISLGQLKIEYVLQ